MNLVRVCDLVVITGRKGNGRLKPRRRFPNIHGDMPRCVLERGKRMEVRQVIWKGRRDYGMKTGELVGKIYRSSDVGRVDER